jgi:uncharacterized protein YqfA (UPF0365 family)
MEGIAVGTALLIALGAFLLLFLFWAVPVGLWVTAFASGVYVKLSNLVGMRFRKVAPRNIILPLISATKAGLKLNIDELEAHYLAGGDIQTPKVSAMAKDGIQLIAIARVTVRANINRLVGGAGEETILARVGEGIVSTIGSAASHAAVLENPDAISKTVLAKGLDSGTAFEILSIDQEHRSRASNRPGRGGQADRPGEGRGAARDGRSHGAGKQRKGPGDESRGRPGPGRSTAGDRRSLQEWQPWHYGLYEIS